MDSEALFDAFYSLQGDAFELFKRKHIDYGSGNIAKFGEYGVLIRASDKIERLVNLLKNHKPTTNESIEDSWIDLANYALIALLCRRGDWPGAGES